jgi:hypothetical protein
MSTKYKALDIDQAYFITITGKPNVFYVGLK